MSLPKFIKDGKYFKLKSIEKGVGRKYGEIFHKGVRNQLPATQSQKKKIILSIVNYQDPALLLKNKSNITQHICFHMFN